MQERAFIITRPTGFTVTCRPASCAELWDAMAAHGWPAQHAAGDARDMWAHGARRGDRDPWSVTRG